MRVLLVLLFPSLALAAGHFKVPDGWTDLTTPENRAVLAPEQRATLSQAIGGADFFAGDLAHMSPKFMTNVIGNIRHEATQVNRLTLLGFAEGMSLGAARDGRKDAVLDSKMVDFNGVQVMRVVMKGQEQPVDVRSVCYLLPMAERTAILVFTTETSKLAEYEPVFDATARATTGLAAAPPEPGSVQIGNPKLVAGIIGGLVVVIVVVFVSRRRRS
jgi:hypothetical protein